MEKRAGKNADTIGEGLFVTRFLLFRIFRTLIWAVFNVKLGKIGKSDSFQILQTSRPRNEERFYTVVAQ